MIPRGLAIATAAGVAVAAALGVIMSPYARDAAPVYVEGVSLSLLVESADHGLGEDIHARLINTGSVTVEFADGTHYGLEVMLLDGTHVYAAPPQDTAGPLGPRDSVEFTWDQGRPDGTPVHPGTYRIVSEGASGDGEAARASVTVNIHG